MKKEFPFLEFDPEKNALINSNKVIKAIDIPDRCVICFFQDVINKLNQQKKLALRKSEGCLTVEMEAAALFAVAKFREVVLGQILYGGDYVGGKVWNSRKYTKKFELREKMLWLAAETCLEL